MAITFKKTFDCAQKKIGFLVVCVFRYWNAIAVSLLLSVGLIVSLGAATSNVQATLHNLSKTGPGTVKATDADGQVCVFCHTPHGANTSAKTPLWNRNGTALKTYTPYTSSSLDATSVQDALNGVTGGSSVLCLSCHDGMIALGQVNVLNGKANQIIAGANVTMPAGSGVTTGFTRNLGGTDGKDLTNDHPISITYDHNLAVADGELRDLDSSQRYPSGVPLPGTSSVIGLRSSGIKPLLPLEPTGTNGAGQVQCASCHDPHITDDKFLRLNRFQKVTPAGGAFSQANDIICLACHDKLGTTWSQSAHANSTVADEAYTAAGSTLRGFPAGTKVWEAACLNCHDTHTVTGARRLLREGTDDTNNPKQGGKSAIEQTCYQCHSSTTLTTLGPLSAVTATGATGVVPDIRAEFNRTIRMPIVTAAQGGGTGSTEIHDITNADFIESAANLGAGDTTKRHVECTDCHNPHRVIRNELFDGTGDGTKRTHQAGGTTANNGADGNIASGVLRGIWGVEPTYPVSSTTWPNAPTYTVKKGNPGASTLKTATHLTREYQLCLKCHSDFANSLTASAYPSLGAPGGTASGSNGVSKYTNVAAEFAVNANDALTGADQGESGNDPAFAPAASNGAPTAAPNHRSWHPVIFPTGRTSYERTASNVTSGSNAFSNIRPPFNITDGSNPSDTRKIGKQTMQCSDCHGEYDSWTQGADRNSNSNGPNLATVQGPHGSSKNFLLKGVWDITVKIQDASGGNNSNAGGYTICGRCHDPQNGKGGFSNGDNAHNKSDHTQLARCMFCHIAVPHGWKNKAFLANLNCLGPEVGKAAGCTNAFGQSNQEVTKQLWAAPYYNGSILRIASWKSSNAWTDTSCGTGSTTGSGWMSGTCQNASTTQQAQNPPLPAAGGY